MADAAWKSWERTVAREFGGQRRGPDYGGRGGGTNDVIVDGWSIEVKLLSRPSFGDLLAAARQAKHAAQGDEIPVGIIRRKGDRRDNAIAVMTLSSFMDWFGGSVE